MNISAEQKLILGMQLVFNDFKQVCALSPHIYTAKSEASKSGTIGAHMRHVLEFIEIIVTQYKGDTIDYESRERNSEYERDAEAAMKAFEGSLKSLSLALSESGADYKVDICEMPAFGSGQVRVPSSLGREVLYAIEHSIHHYAIIAMIASEYGAKFEEGFGLAPATRENEMKALMDKQLSKAA